MAELFYHAQRLTDLAQAVTNAADELVAVSSVDTAADDAAVTARSVAAVLADWQPWFAASCADTSMTTWQSSGPAAALMGRRVANGAADWPALPEGDYEVVTVAELDEAWGEELAGEFVTDVTHNVAYSLACIGGYNAADGNLGLSSSSSGIAASPHLCLPIDPVMAVRRGDPYVVGHVVPEGESEAAQAVLDAEAAYATELGVERVEYFGADGAPANPYLDQPLPLSGTMEIGDWANRFVEVPAGMLVAYRLTAPGIYEVRVHVPADEGIPEMSDDLYANVEMSEPEWPLASGIPADVGAVIDVIDVVINSAMPS